MAKGGNDRKDAVMSNSKPHLRTLEEIERECIPGLVNVLRKEGGSPTTGA